MIKNITLKNFRIHDNFYCEFSPNVSVIYGKNGKGKTSILEAISLIYAGKSFRSSAKEIINNKKDWMRVDSSGDFSRTFKFILDGAQKEFIIDEKKSKIMPKKNKFPVVLFVPDDMRLISGSPARRRKYLDNLAEQLFFNHSAVLRKYDRILQQRNKLLKNENLDNKNLFAWNLNLAKMGAEIIERRVEIVDILNKNLEKVYNSISGKKDKIKIIYPENQKLNEQKILSALEKNQDKDLILGFTSVGPHRHDFQILFNGKNAENIMSRGEIRTLILALKFIELQIIEEKLKIRPLFLLDDVFGELDDSRKKNLSKTFSTHQVIITTTEKIKNLPKETVFIKV